MGGLAVMAWRLANLRAFDDTELPDAGIGPSSRAAMLQKPLWILRASREYYNIIDRISRGEQP